MVVRKRISRMLKLLLALIFTLSQMPIISAIGGTSTTRGQAQPNNIVSGVNEEFTISYTINPEEISKTELDPFLYKEKEIVLVIDTSGSMNDNGKLSTIKTVAKNFIDKFKDESKTSIAIVKYSNYSETVSGLVKKDKFNTLKNSITNLTAVGGTNIGDGLRRAYYILENSNANANKYVILMTDGVPTAFTAKIGTVSYSSDYWYNVGTIINNSGEYDFSSINEFQFEKANPSNANYIVYNGSNTITNALNYATEMGTTISSSNKNIKSSVIGFGSGTKTEVLDEIAESLNTTAVNASDGTKLNEIYTNIANQIVSDLSKPIQISIPIPAGLEVTQLPVGLSIDPNTNLITGSTGTVNYKLVGDKYIADAINLNISYKAKEDKSAEFTVSGDSMTATYTMPNKTYSQNFNDINIRIISSQELKAPISVSNRLFPETQGNTFKPGDTFYVDYEIDPSEAIEKRIDSVLQTNDKEIVLVVDNSYSMSTEYIGSYPNRKLKLQVVRDAVSIFINKFSGDENTKISIVTYNYLASNPIIVNQNTSLTTTIPITSNGSNIGDGLRKAYYSLKNSANKNSEKYIVLLTDGDPYHYSSSSRNSNNYFLGEGNSPFYRGYLYQDNDYNYKANSTEYAKQVMNMINGDSTTKVNTYMIPFVGVIDKSKLTEIAGNSERVKITNTSTTAGEIGNIYSEVADQIKIPTVKGVNFQVNLPEGLKVEDIKNSVSGNIITSLSIQNQDKKVSGFLDDIYYSNRQVANGIERYTVDTTELNKFKIRIKVKVKEDMEPGEYVLCSEDNNAYVKYTDVDGCETTKVFNTQIPIVISDESLDFRVIKFGLFQKSAKNIDYVKDTNVTLVKGAYYELGSVLEIESKNAKITNDNLLSLFTSTIGNENLTITGNKNVRLYLLSPSRELIQIHFNSNANGRFDLPINHEFKEGEQYILTQDVVVKSASANDPKKITNEVTIKDVTNSGNITDVSETKSSTFTVSVMDELPDLD